ncbi:FAD-binding oxidoreductase [Pseudorhodoferax soli]|uniref:FAD/FMN-containing dehydrogenase n=1 Tax=Pseudorhodoferax soli TaxID=545864 RepID=A0A368XKY9_9BURK|nr:FAD-binding oxidoreductase [Pseudorhodoferax soli]RCW68633.1 FAD/FMN-containing dehydrogenase [Pseudorhodoferax soli]
MGIVDRLRYVVGAAYVVQGDGASDANAGWEQDWRRRTRGHGLALVRPQNTQEVAEVVRLCAAAGVSIVPQGGNTGLVEGSIPDGSGTQVVLSLNRMTAVRDLDPSNLTVTVEAGCILQALHEVVERAGYLFPLSLAAKGSCTIGGNLATNAGGTQVVRYGNARNLCLGLEVVTPRGEVWQSLSGLRKDNTGYDLRDLFVGSEGTLGVITAATLQLYPQPRARLTAWAAVPSESAALELLARARRNLGAGLTGFELMGRFAVSMVCLHLPQLRVPVFRGTDPYFVLIELSDSESEPHARERLEALLGEALEDGCMNDAVIAESLAQTRELWEIRESIPLAAYKEGVMAAHDVALPISAIPRFIAETQAQLTGALPGVRVANFGHLGDGNLHYNVHAPAGRDAPEFLRRHEEQIRQIVYASAVALGGSFSAEHGIGRLKLHRMESHKAPVELEMMRSIKRALDPIGVMNPGCIVR